MWKERKMYNKNENVSLVFVAKSGEIALKKNQLVLCDYIQ